MPRPLRDIPQVSLGFGSLDFYANNADLIWDVDVDGWKNVISGGWTESEIMWYRNPGKAGLERVWKWEPHLLVNARAENEAFHLLDLDGDGRNDLVWGRGHDYGVSWWEQGEPKPDGTTTWTEHLIDDSWSQAHRAWADLDGDGRGELITGKRVRGHGGRDPNADEPPALYGYSWDPDAKQFVRYPIAPTSGLRRYITRVVGCQETAANAPCVSP